MRPPTLLMLLLPFSTTLACGPALAPQPTTTPATSGTGSDPQLELAIDTLIVMLDDDDEFVRAAAAQGLVEIGEPAVGPILEAMGGMETETRIVAVNVLGEMGEKAAEAVPALVEMLDDEETVTLAAYALGRIGPAAEEAIPDILSLTDDLDLEQAAVYSLVLMGEPATDALLDLVMEGEEDLVGEMLVAAGDEGFDAAMGLARSDDPDARLAALEGLTSGDGPLDVTTQKTLWKLLHDEDGFVYDEASRLVAGIGPEGVPLLVRLVEKGDGQDRIYAVAVLGGMAGIEGIEPWHDRIVETLEKALHAPELPTRVEAARSLGLYGASSEEILDGVVDLLELDEPEIDNWVFESLDRLGATDELDMIEIEECIEECDARGRMGAAGIITRLGPEASGLEDDLVALLGDVDAETDPALAVEEMAAYYAAIDAVGGKPAKSHKSIKKTLAACSKKSKKACEIPSPCETTDRVPDARAVPMLRLVIESSQPQLACTAVALLGSMGPDARAAAPEIAGAAGSDDEDLRRHAFLSLEAIGPDAAHAADLIVEHVDDPDDDVAMAALAALGAMGPEAADAWQPVFDLYVEEVDWALRSRALDCLEKLGPPPGDLGAEVIAYIGSEDDQEDLSHRMLPVLVGVLPDPLPVIEKLLESDDPDVRTAAVHAARRLGTEAGDLLPTLVEQLATSDMTLLEASINAVVAVQEFDDTDLAPHVRAFRESEDGVEQIVALMRFVETFDRMMEQAEASERIALATELVAPYADMIPELVDRLGDDHAGLRIVATIALMAFGAGARDAVPDLAVNAEHENAMLRTFTAMAIAMTGGETPWPV